MTNDAIKEKIKKLLAIAAEGSGTTEDEQACQIALNGVPVFALKVSPVG
jgi:hypothetical protein